MTAADHVIDWRVGRMRLALPVVIHALALKTGVELALQWSAMWLFVAFVICSAAGEAVQWRRARGTPQVLRLIPGGLELQARTYRARRAWLAPGWTAIWLGDRRADRQLVHVLRFEVSQSDHAALRRHLKAIDYV